MFEPTIACETDRLLAGMKTFAAETGQTLKAVFVDQMRLASNSLAKNFPAKSQGMQRKAIAGDIGNIFIEIDDPLFLENWAGIGEKAPARVFKTKSGAVLGVEQASYNAQGDMTAMDAHHKRYRTKAGRVTKAGSFTRDIGRWKYINRQVVAKGAVARYARKYLFPRVGAMKSGWLLPSGAPVQSKAPAWVLKARHAVGEQSEYTDQMDLFATGFLKLNNRITYAARQMGIVRIELQKRQRDLKTYAGKRLQQRIDKFNSRSNG